MVDWKGLITASIGVLFFLGSIAGITVAILHNESWWFGMGLGVAAGCVVLGMIVLLIRLRQTLEQAGMSAETLTKTRASNGAYSEVELLRFRIKYRYPTMILFVWVILLAGLVGVSYTTTPNPTLSAILIGVAGLVVLLWVFNVMSHDHKQLVYFIKTYFGLDAKNTM